MFRKILLLAAIGMLSSCSYIYGDQGIIRNRDTTYLKSTTVPPLRIPPGLSSSTIQSHYPISDRYYSTSELKVDLTPPELYARKPAPAPVTQQQPQPHATASVAEVNVKAQPQSKPRTLVDYFRNGGSLTNLNGNSSTTPNTKNTANSANNNTTASAQPQHKPRTIQEYLEQGGGPLSNLFSGSHSS